MIPSPFRISIIFLVLVTLLLAACGDDDPVSPGTPTLWKEVRLDLTPGETRMLAVDFNGEHGLAAGVLKTGGKDWAADNEFFRLQANGTWLPEDLGVIPASILFLDLALDPGGKPVLAGIQDSSPNSVLLDLRGPDPEYFTGTDRGLMTVDGEGSFMVAGGMGQGGQLWTSTSVGTWEVDDLTGLLTGNNDSGFQDVYVRGDRAVACGYDDGADTLQVILERTATTGWTKVPYEGPSSRTLWCVALTEDGTIFVGGVDGGGGPSPRAFLVQRTADGLWAELILPDAEALHGVSDILITSDGSFFLACRGEGEGTMANLVNACSCGIIKEITPFPGGLFQLDEAAGGDIYAVGFRLNEPDGTEEGVMLVRTP